MNNEENVYEGTNKTGEIATARGSVGERREENAQSVLGKFKDVDALASAYSSLQAEFTRRSQRLRELERAVENFPSATRAEVSGAEKLRRNAVAHRTENRRFDEFLTELSGAQESRAETVEKETLDEVTTVAEGEPGCGEDLSKTDGAKASTDSTVGIDGGEAVKEAVSAEAKEPLREEAPEMASKEEISSSVAGGDKTLSSEALYEQVCRDEKTRLRIIGEYLASIGRSGAPLTSVGTGTFASPPLKAKSIGDAGNMALRYFKSSGEV